MRGCRRHALFEKKRGAKATLPTLNLPHFPTTLKGTLIQ